MKHISTRNLILLLSLITIGFAALPITAQTISRETYDHAIQMRSGILSPKMKNRFVIPHWIGSRDEFWYKRETAKGYEFVQVDAATGHKRPAFDHEKLAQALSTVTGTRVRTDNLPFDDFEFNADGSAIHFTVAEK